MQQTRREILDDLLDFTGELNDDSARDSAARLLNRALETIWIKRPWSQYVSPAPFQLTLVPNSRSYALPDHFGRFRSPEVPVRNLTKGTDIRLLGDEDLFRLFPQAGSTLEVASTPSYCALLGSVGVQAQPLVTGEALEVLSSDVDDTDIRVGIIGDDSNGHNTRNQVTLNGTTPVAIGTWGYVDEFGKSYAAGVDPATPLYSSRGTVTLRKVADATILQQLFPQEATRLHRVLTFYPKPNVADVMVIPFIRSVNRQLADSDVIPSHWGPALFEEMLIQWRLNRGEIQDSVRQPRPALLDLECWENENMPRGTRPFGAL